MQQQPAVYERRMVNRMKSYWDMIRGQSEIPQYAHFNKNSVSDMWENCMLFSITQDSTRTLFKCEYTGTDLNKSFSADLKDRYVSIHSRDVLPGSNLIEYMVQSAEKKEFVMSEGSFVAKNGQVIKYRDCIMPFAAQDGRISHLVVAISWRAF